MRAGGRVAKRRIDRSQAQTRGRTVSDPTDMGQCVHKFMALFRNMSTREQALAAKRFHDNGHKALAKALFSEMTRRA